LASKSLLEGIVYGALAGRRLRDRAGAPLRQPDLPPPGPLQPLPANAVFDLRRLAWRRAGIERSGEGLEKGLTELARLSPAFETSHSRNSREGFEADNMYQVISLIVRCALARRESRGCHFRSDYPHKDARFRKHSRISKSHDVEFAAISRAA
jgi:L-aspartate oxidase